MEPESGELNYLTEAMNKIIVSNYRILIEKRPRNAKLKWSQKGREITNQGHHEVFSLPTSAH